MTRAVPQPSSASSAVSILGAFPSANDTFGPTRNGVYPPPLPGERLLAAILAETLESASLPAAVVPHELLPIAIPPREPARAVARKPLPPWAPWAIVGVVLVCVASVLLLIA